MHEILERRYRRLMWTYPAAYRRERADEIIDVLMQGSAEGRHRPSWPDTRALIVGGLRARAGVDRHRSLGANLRLIVRMVVALVLAKWAGEHLMFFAFERVDTGRFAQPPVMDRAMWQTTASAVGFALLAVLLFTRSTRLTLVAVAGTIATSFINPDGSWLNEWLNPDWLATWAVLVLVAMTHRYRDDPRIPAAWAWLILGYVAINDVWQIGMFIGPPPLLALRAFPYAQGYVLLVAVLVWSLVDARPAVALTLYLIGGAIFRISEGVWSFGDYAQAPRLVLLAVLGATTLAAIVRFRQQVRT